MARYLDPKSDLTFKRIFGEHPHLLISFLNAIMPFEPGKFIEEIHYLPAEQVPDILGKKNSIVDVKCTDNYKNQFIVEMQMFWTETFNNRMVFNAGKAYVRQLNKREEYNLIKPVYTLAIINDIFDHKTDNFYHHYQIVNRENTDEVIKGLEFVLVELPKFSPQNFTDRKLATLWLHFLKEVDEDMRTLPVELQENEDIRQAVELCEEAAFTPAELEAYEAYWDAVRVEKTIIADRKAIMEEFEKTKAILEESQVSLEKSFAEGEHKKAIEIAKNLKLAGVTTDIIAETTGLSINELNESHYY